MIYFGMSRAPHAPGSRATRTTFGDRCSGVSNPRRRVDEEIFYMRAMILPQIVSLSEADSPLKLVDLPVPQLGTSEVRVRLKACGLCHTELDEIEGRTRPPKFAVVLGHEVVGQAQAGRVTGAKVLVMHE